MAGRFSWINFGVDFVHSIVFSDKNKGEKPKEDTRDLDQLMPFIDLISNKPDPEITKMFRAEIEQNFIFTHEDYVVKICKYLPGCRSIKNVSEMIEYLRNRRTTSDLIALYDTFLLKHGRVVSNEPYSMFKCPMSVDLSDVQPKDVSLHDYQEEAVNKLKSTFIDSSLKSGFLVMPTGSGKTRTAVYFVLRYLVSSGYQVIWLTHRTLLVEQAAQAFFDTSYLVNLDHKNKDTLRISCVSQEHSSIKQVEKEDDVVLLMVPSVSRNTDYLDSILKDKVIVVVDEAHHTYARTYRKTIDLIRSLRKDALLLGLTATPIRTNEEETGYLRNVYENRIIYNIPMSNLITNGVLAKPSCMEIDTDYSVVTTVEDRKYIKKWGELPPRLVNRIASSAKRNKKIVNTYLQNTKKGDKTLIFAMNQVHAVMLYEDFKKNNVNAAVVYSGQGQNDEKIRAFKDGAVDVLININILTEGSDIPGVNALYLTRPTKSDVLLMQMIGRGMRGVRVGGKDKVTIVDFVDKWGNFVQWLNPEAEISYELTDVPDGYIAKPTEKYLIEWEVIRDIYEGMFFPSLGQVAPPYISLPYGWYQLREENGNDNCILVFEDQYRCYTKMAEDILNGKVDKAAKPAYLISRYWRNFEKYPGNNDVKLMHSHIKKYKRIPQFFLFVEREKIDPVLISMDLRNNNVGIKDIEVRINDIYNANKEMIDSIYKDYDNYRDLVLTCIKQKDGAVPTGISLKLIDEPLLPFDREPYHDIQELAKRAFEFFQSTYKKAPKVMPKVYWTEKQPQGYFGLYSSNKTIRINSCLNSRDVPAETIVYLLYHELLHYKQDLQHDLYRLGHDSQFREWEHEFPDYIKHEQFLDSKFRKFDTTFNW